MLPKMVTKMKYMDAGLAPTQPHVIQRIEATYGAPGDVNVAGLDSGVCLLPGQYLHYPAQYETMRMPGYINC